MPSANTWRVGGCALAALAIGAAPAPARPDLTAITNVSVIDVIRGEAIPAQTVLIDGRVIAAVVPAASFKPAKEATLIDGTGKFLMPGLFDAHVHYVDPENFGPLMIANGVLFVREMGNATDVIIPVRDGLNAGKVVGPEMICTGAIVDGDPPVWPFSEPCDTPEEARAAVRKLHAAGVNQIKVYSRLKKDVYRAAVAEAKAVGLKAVGHVPGECTLGDAIAAGQASNEHLMMVEKLIPPALPPGTDLGEDQSGGMWATGRYWMLYPRADKAAISRELRKLSESEMLQCPTLVVAAGIANAVGNKGDADPRMVYVPAGLRAFWGGEQYQGFGLFMEAALPHMKAMVGEMYRAGVPMMVGTDLANPYVFAGFSVHDEMKQLVEAGFSAADAIRAATIVPARFMGVQNRLGTIEPEKAATFVLLAANPLDDIGNTSKIESVWQRGERHDRAALDALLKGVEDAVAASAPAEEDVTLDLPGEVVLRGTYKIKFGPFDAGTEDVLITKTADGYSIMGHSKPQGGPQGPYVMTWHVGPDFKFRSATYRQLSKQPVEAAYTLESGALRATATREGKPLPPASVDIGPDDAISAPTYAADFVWLGATTLEPGEAVEMEAASFGYPDWKPQKAPFKAVRQVDADLVRPGGVTVRARCYRQVLTTPMGAFTTDLWTDERGIPLKAVTTMPFGTMTIELQP